MNDDIDNSTNNTSDDQTTNIDSSQELNINTSENDEKFTEKCSCEPAINKDIRIHKVNVERLGKHQIVLMTCSVKFPKNLPNNTTQVTVIQRS